eukprot:scaffold194_cov277-Pinguiococcus_pyrenoidosus.AAC.14
MDDEKNISRLLCGGKQHDKYCPFLIMFLAQAKLGEADFHSNHRVKHTKLTPLDPVQNHRFPRNFRGAFPSPFLTCATKLHHRKGISCSKALMSFRRRRFKVVLLGEGTPRPPERSWDPAAAPLGPFERQWREGLYKPSQKRIPKRTIATSHRFAL